MLDGVLYWQPSHSDVPLRGISLEAIDHVESIRGPGSVIHGSNASSGVINVVMKRGVTATAATFEAGDLGFFRGSAYGAWRLGTGTVSLGVEHTQEDPHAATARTEAAAGGVETALMDRRQRGSSVWLRGEWSGLSATLHRFESKTLGLAGLTRFDNVRRASVLASLASDASIIAAALYDREGILFVGHPDSMAAPAMLPTDAGSGGEGDTAIMPVVVPSGELVGFAYVRSDRRGLVALTRWLRTAELANIVLALMVAFGLATRLHRTILGPVSVLSQTARKVREQRDFGARVSLEGPTNSDSSDEWRRVGRSSAFQ